MQEAEGGVGKPHRTVGAVPRGDRVGGAPGFLRPGRRPLGGETGDARGEVPLPLLAEHGHHVAVRGDAVGVEDLRQPGNRGEPGHVTEALLGKGPGKGVDRFSDLLDLLGVHGPWPQRDVVGRGAAPAYWSITSSSALRQAEQNGTSFLENMMQSTSARYAPFDS